MRTQAIRHKRLGDRVFEILERKILHGQFSAGEHLSEARICSALEVSRTPVREALFKLAQDGLVVSRPNQGFFVAPYSARKVAETYPILGVLEALALETSAPFDPALISQLEAQNRKSLSKRSSSKARFEADRQFHRLLTCNCANESLLELIETKRGEIIRWDGGQDRGLADPEKAYLEHAGIVDRLKRGKNKAAARLLTKHWNAGIKTVTEWMKQHENDQSL